MATSLAAKGENGLASDRWVFQPSFRGIRGHKILPKVSMSLALSTDRK